MFWVALCIMKNQKLLKVHREILANLLVFRYFLVASRYFLLQINTKCRWGVKFTGPEYAALVHYIHHFCSP